MLYAEPVGQPDYGTYVAGVLYTVQCQTQTSGSNLFDGLRFVRDGKQSNDLLRRTQQAGMV